MILCWDTRLFWTIVHLSHVVSLKTTPLKALPPSPSTELPFLSLTSFALQFPVGDVADVGSHAAQIVVVVAAEGVVVGIAGGAVQAEFAASAHRQQPRVIADLLEKRQSHQRTLLGCQ